MSGSLSTWASASEIQQSAVDQISGLVEIAVTNPFDHVEHPSVLLISSATLDTKSPDGSGVSAPAGEIFLSLQMSSGASPASSANGPNFGNYFAQMTPLPASALWYVAKSGGRYPATRINPVNWTNTWGTSNPDGLVDATYYFTVPITNREGTIVMEPSRTLGVEYDHNVEQAPTMLEVGGPTRFPLSFPKNLTVAVPRTTTKNVLPTGQGFTSFFNFGSTLILLIFVLWVNRKIQRWRRRRNRDAPTGAFVRETPTAQKTSPPPESRSPTPTNSKASAPTDGEPATTTTALVRDPAMTVAAENQSSTPTTDKSTLRVDVLGPLQITPALAPMGEPARAIITFLAMHTSRLVSLDEIQTAVWPLMNGVNDIKRPVMLNYMADARKVVGEHHLPAATGKSGYQLVDITSDWAEFQELMKDASVTSKEDALALRQRALKLVRGVPFASENSRYFTWALTPTFTYKIIDAVTSLAHSVATNLILQGDFVGADEVLRRGLLCEPASLILWEDLTDLMFETHDAAKLHFHWRAAEQVLGPKDVQALRAREIG